MTSFFTAKQSLSIEEIRIFVTMNFDQLHQRIDLMPMLKILIPFATGILVANSGTLPLWLLAGAFVCSGVVAMLFHSRVAILTMIFTTGFGLAQFRTPQRTTPLHTPTLFEIAVDGIPQIRPKGQTAHALIRAWRDPHTGHWHPTEDRLLVFCDSLTTLQADERLSIEGVIRPFRDTHPSYKRLMQRRGYIGTLSLHKQGILSQQDSLPRSFHLCAAQRMASLAIEGDAGAVVNAMTTGDRSRLTAQLRGEYSRSGFSHLLAVSGLRTGVVFLLLNLVLWWLPLLRWGHLLRNTLSIVAVWIFVAAAGFPPSAIRAAVMYTLLQLSLAGGEEYSSMNAWAGAALLMLMWQPAWIGDLSFQLSFLAVGGIISWGVPLCRRLRTRFRVVNWVVDALVISLVASLVTAPLISHTFGITPLVGILLNPLAILLATILVAGGVVWLILPFEILSTPLRFVISHAAVGINSLAHWTASTPHTSVEYTLSTTATATIYVLFLVFTLTIWNFKPKKKLPLHK